MVRRKGVRTQATPDKVTSILNGMGRPVFYVDAANGVIEDILSWYLTIRQVETRELEALGTTLATCSDAELCYMWRTTVGEYLLEQEKCSDKDQDQWLRAELAGVTTGNIHEWEQYAEFGIARLKALREEKSKLAELIRRTQVSDVKIPNVMRPILSYTDHVTLCVFWDYLCHYGIVPEYMSELGDSPSAGVIRGMIFYGNEVIVYQHGKGNYFTTALKTLIALLKHLPFSNMKTFWKSSNRNNFWNPKMG